MHGTDADPTLADPSATAAPDARGPGAARKVLFSAMKNEAPFVLEWIAYHKVIGFDEIVICSNPSNDGMEEMLAALADAGEIRHLQATVPPGESPQRLASAVFARQVGFRPGDWYLWLDADEFLNVHVEPRTVDALIARLGPQQAALLNWRVFGSGGNATFPGRFIDPAFVGASTADFVANLEQKTLFRFSGAVRGFGRYGINRPLMARASGLQPADVAVGNGGPAGSDQRIHRRWLQGADTGATARVTRDEFGWALAQINHYMVRTPDLYALKRVRGRGYKPDAVGVKNNRHTGAFFATHDRNEAEDRSILHWQTQVTTEIARLTAIPAVAAAAERSAALLRDVLEELAAPKDPDSAQSPKGERGKQDGGARPGTDRPTGPGRARNVLFSAMKNEAPFLLEWIAYHKVIGFERIIIVSNDCTDATAELLDALSEAGEIAHIAQKVPEGVPPQASAAALANSSGLVEDGDWCIFLDADEFLNIHVGDGTVADLIRRVGDHQGILINWKRFGDSGQASFPGRYVSDAFTMAETPFPPFTMVKTFFRKSDRLTGFSPHLHRCSLAPGAVDLYELINGAGQSLLAAKKPKARQNHKAWVETGEQTWGRVWRDEIGYDIAQINHYMVRDPLSFSLKASRGRGNAATGQVNARHDSGYYDKNNRNDVADRSILRWEDRVTREMARLTAIPGVGLVAARSEALMHDILAGNDAPGVPQAASVAAPLAVPSVSSGVIFPADEAGFVQDHYAKASVILEYGCGASTLLAAEMGKAVTSVEADRALAAAMAQQLAGAGRTARVHPVDLGPTDASGLPTRPRMHGRFHRYPLSVWDLPDLGDPDLVLIAGRFRAACLVAVRLRARRPTTVLFDGYQTGGPHVGLEHLARKEETLGRIARFTVTPGPIPPDMLTTAIGWFSDPR